LVLLRLLLLAEYGNLLLASFEILTVLINVPVMLL
jgi:hypothetical protein